MAGKKVSSEETGAEGAAEAAERELVLLATEQPTLTEDPSQWPPAPEEGPSDATIELEQALKAASSMADWLGMRYRVHKMGVKFTPTNRDRALVTYLTWTGLPQAEVAKQVGMSIEVLRNHFAYELEHGRRGLLTDVVKVLAHKALSGDMQAINKFMNTQWPDLWGEKKAEPAVVVNNAAPMIEHRSPADPEKMDRVIDAIALRVADKIASK